jgi:hypothetical protein
MIKKGKTQSYPHQDANPGKEENGVQLTSMLHLGHRHCGHSLSGLSIHDIKRHLRD